MDFAQFLELAKAAGLPGLVVGVAVLVFVYVGSFTNLFKTGGAKRLAVLVSGLLFSGIELGNLESSVVAAIGLMTATGGKLLIDAVITKVKSRR